MSYEDWQEENETKEHLKARYEKTIAWIIIGIALFGLLMGLLYYLD